MILLAIFSAPVAYILLRMSLLWLGRYFDILDAVEREIYADE